MVGSPFHVAATTAAHFRARLAGELSPAGERTPRVLAGYRRTAGGRGRGQARPFVAADLAAVLATCHRPRRRVRGCRPRARPARRGDRGDASERGERPPVGRRRRGGRRRRRAGDGPPRQDEPGGRDEGRAVREGAMSPSRSRRCGPPRARRPRTKSCRSRRRWWGCGFQAAARAAGVEPVTAHSGRVGLASELTRRGASTTDVMLAGNRKTPRMVAYYSAGATAERGAVAQYL